MNLRFAPILLSLLLLAGCSSLPKDFDADYTSALKSPESTTVGRIAMQGSRAHSGQSGFALLATGESAFRARSGGAAIAEKTLDVQYYIWESDESGRLLIDSLVRAADRGVRVRLLLDDLTTTGNDLGVATINRHPNIEIRLFNPNLNRKRPGLGMLADISRINHRMHNKVFIADNAIAVVGGRNVGNHYFGVDTTSNFRDLDLLAIGPVVSGVSDSFDLFWNSEYSIPAEVIVDQAQREDFEGARQELFDWTEEARKSFPYPVFISRQKRAANLKAWINRFVWADAVVLFDHPDRASGNSDKPGIASVMHPLLKNVEKELLIESAYFIPGKGGVELMANLTARDVNVHVLTNSLASNDVAAAFSGYARYRVPMLESGVDLYELMPDMDTAKKDWSTIAADSKASLHTKAMVFDRKDVFIGSMNLDPRSGSINTEIGLLVRSPELSRQVVEFMEIGTLPDNSFNLELVESSFGTQKQLNWVAERDGEEIRYTSEPETTAGRKASAWMMSLLPIEKQL